MNEPLPLPRSSPAPADARDEDVGCIARAARGDREGLAALYDRHARTMLALGIRILRRRREAEDILHDVFVEAWRRAGDYDPRRGTVRTWLLLRMRSRCLDRVRSAAYSRGESLDDREEATLRRGQPGTDGGAEELEAAPDRARVRAALAALSDAHRAVLELGYFEGLSSSEIGARLQIPTGTVKSRVRAALAILRDALGEP